MTTASITTVSDDALSAVGVTGSTTPTHTPDAVDRVGVATRSIPLGCYRHFKGHLYDVIGVAELVDTEQVYVVYRPLYGDRRLVLRGIEEFVSTVNRNGRPEPRFQKIVPARSPGWWQTLVKLIAGERRRRGASDEAGPDGDGQ